MGEQQAGKWVVPNPQIPRTFGIMNLCFRHLDAFGRSRIYGDDDSWHRICKSKWWVKSSEQQSKSKAERDAKVAELKAKEEAAKTQEEKDTLKDEREAVESER